MAALMSKSFRSIAPYAVPFFIFMGGLALVSGVNALGSASHLQLLQNPKYWIYPLQTTACAIALACYWKHYHFGIGNYWLALAGGLLALGIWVSPHVLFDFPSRPDGFDPTIFNENSFLYWLTIGARFARLVIIVPLVEEIFWRSFLMRYFINENFEKVAFGTFQPLSFIAVAGFFMMVHETIDWPAAFLCGLLYNGIAVYTKSLATCVFAHAVTNLGLGIYIMTTRQWGFW